MTFYRAFFFVLLLVLQVFLSSFTKPTEQFLKIHSFEVITKTLDQKGVNLNCQDLLQDAIEEEKHGFLGYHASRFGFLVYQDIIRIAIEEILKIPIRKDFHFLRIPGDPAIQVDSAQRFLCKYNNAIDDSDPVQAIQLVSINLALYGHYDTMASCTVKFFVENSSSIHTEGFEKRIALFFAFLGIDEKYIAQAFRLAKQHLPEKGGLLLQFFDFSEDLPYTFSDKYVYPSLSGGPLQGIKQPSEFYLHPNNQEFPEFRLVITNKGALNPNGPLYIKRYTYCSEEHIQEYENALRNFVCSLPFNKKKVEKYKEKLLKYWAESEEEFIAA